MGIFCKVSLSLIYLACHLLPNFPHFLIRYVKRCSFRSHLFLSTPCFFSCQRRYDASARFRCKNVLYAVFLPQHLIICYIYYLFRINNLIACIHLWFCHRLACAHWFLWGVGKMRQCVEHCVGASRPTCKIRLGSASKKCICDG